MKRTRFLFFILIFVFFFSPIPVHSTNDLVQLTILYTSDLHGYITGAFSPREENVGGGILRCATLIKEIRKQEKNVLLIDLGDLFCGSIESFPSKGEIVVNAVKHLKYDFLIPGNHEFDWGKSRLIELYKQMSIPVVVCNMHGNSSNASPPIPNWQPFVIVTNSDIKIGIVGLTTPLIPRWFRPKYIEGFSFQNSVEAIKTTMLYVRKANPDLLILAAHQGLREWKDDEANELNTVLKMFPEFELVLGAHTHQAIDNKKVYSAIYSQPGYYGLWLGKATVNFNKKNRKIISINPELIVVDSKIKPDAALSEQLSPYLDEVRKFGSQIVGELVGELSISSSIPGQSATQTLISQAIAEAVDADVVLHTSLSDSLIKSGPVTRWELWKIVPYENTIGKALITVQELKEILEENAKFFGKNQFRGIFGCQYELLVSSSGEIKVGEIFLPPAIEKKGKIALAVNSYDLASAGNRLPKLREIMERKDNMLIEYEINTRNALEVFLKKNSPYKPFVADGVKVKKRRQ